MITRINARRAARRKKYARSKRVKSVRLRDESITALALEVT
jgi:hypothetical protein